MPACSFTYLRDGFKFATNSFQLSSVFASYCRLKKVQEKKKKRSERKAAELKAKGFDLASAEEAPNILNSNPDEDQILF